MAKLVDRHESNLSAFHSTYVGFRNIGGHDEVAASFVGFAEELQAVRLKGVGVPFAFDGVYAFAAVGNDEVDFPVGFVAPEAN